MVLDLLIVKRRLGERSGGASHGSGGTIAG
jgi:hypothetical protein